jgi:hypothetical protein
MTISITEALVKQYLAPLGMLERAIDLCPESEWYSTEHTNRFWHIAYHALFYTHLYLHSSEADVIHWPKHRPNYCFLGPLPVPPFEKPKIEEPYGKEDLLEFLQVCRNEVPAKVSDLNLKAPSGFDWVPLNKLELQLYNIRHLQHHTGQLADRIRNAAGIGVPWVGTV